MLNIAQIPKQFIARKLRPFLKYPNHSWFWSVLEKYRDREGHTLEEVELANAVEIFKCETERKEAIASKRWTWSPKSEEGVDHLIMLLEAFFHPDETFTYLEFGTCYGTTIARVLAHFKNARGIGLEVSQVRSDVARWLINRMDADWHLSKRVEVHKASILDVPLEPNSVDAVLMDTNHLYPDEYEYIMHLTRNNILRKGFIFAVDDPLHTGTDTTRKRFIAEHSDKYKSITRSDKNLWWFFAK
jgi:hypothetical protein